MSAPYRDRGKENVLINGEQAWSDVMDLDDRNKATNVGIGPGRVNGAVKKSWAEMLGSNLPATMNKNILEIVLEKDERGSFIVGEGDCAKVMGKLGIDPRPGVHVEGVQICPNGRGVILVTLKDGIPIDRFCRFDVLDVTSSGIRSVMVKPAGKREVIVKIKGIHPNTRDDGVIDYLSKFAKIITKKVVHGVFGEGPLKGLRNGDRSYKIEVSPKMNIGTYHVIDGQRVTLRYPGQQQTCARCFQTAQVCPGRGMARKCEAAGGPKVDLVTFIRNLWQEIGYSPSEVELDDDINVDLDKDTEIIQQEGGMFTPHKPGSDDSEKYSGVSIKTFPKDTDHGAIVDFLVKSGLDAINMDKIVIKNNGSVTIRNLENAACKVLIDNIHSRLNFGKRLYCNGIIPLTPTKDDTDHDSATTPSSEAMGPPSAAPSTVSQSVIVPPSQSTPELPPILSPLLSPRPSGATMDIGQMSTIPETPDTNIHHQNNLDFLRRNSLSLRSPPIGSLAADILQSESNLHLKKVQSMMLDVKDALSDFGSCVSSFSESSEEEEEKPESMKKGYKSKRKRKKSLTPSKEHFLKKPNTAVSPQH